MCSCSFICGKVQGCSTAKLQAADEPPFLVARGFPARPRCDATRNNACGHSKGGPPAPTSHTGGVPTVCDTPTPAPPDAAPHDARKPLSPLDSPYYGKYMHSSGKAQPVLWEAAAQLGAEKDPTVGCATACGPTSSAISGCIPKPELRSADLSVEHYVPKLQVCPPLSLEAVVPMLPLRTLFTPKQREWLVSEIGGL